MDEDLGDIIEPDDSVETDSDESGVPDDVGE